MEEIRIATGHAYAFDAVRIEELKKIEQRVSEGGDRALILELVQAYRRLKAYPEAVSLASEHVASGELGGGGLRVEP